MVEHQDLDDAALEEELVPLHPLPPVRGHRHIARPPAPDLGVAVDLADDLP